MIKKTTKAKPHHLTGVANARHGKTNRNKALYVRCTEEEQKKMRRYVKNNFDGTMSDYIRSLVPVLNESPEREAG